MSAPGDHCLELIRAADKDRFLACLFAPDDTRPHLAALYAFNLEVARIRESVSEPMLGEIRLQWWHDTIEALAAGGSASHPVAAALGDAMRAASLPKEPLLGLIAARRFDLYDDPMPSLNDLEGYLGETSSMLIQLACNLLAGPEDGRACAEAAGLAGVAYGLTGLLRSLPIHRARGQCYVPREMLEAEGSSVSHLIAGRHEPGVLRTIDRLAAHARRRLAEARAAAKGLPRAVLPAFLPVSLTDGYLKALIRPGFAPLSQVATVPQARRQLRLLWSAWRGSF